MFDRSTFRLTAWVVVAALLIGNVRQAQAQSGTAVKDIQVSSFFGHEIIFSARIESLIEVQQASILIQDQASGIVRVQPLVVGENGQTEFHFDTSQNILPPFVRVSFWYQAALANGQTYTSDMYYTDYIDNRFGEWQSRGAGALSVHWYSSDEAFGQAALDRAQAGLQAIGNLLPLDLSQPVDIYIYATPDDLQGALYLGGETWEAGHANPALGVVMVAIAPGPQQGIEMEQRIPHELAHVILYRQVGGGYNNLPTWLREGMATLAELYPNPDYDRALTDASRKGTLIPLKDLCASFPPNVGQAFLAYAESRSFTRYLRDTYGASSLLGLANVYADGLDCDKGITRALGASLEQLDIRWREAVLGENAARLAFRNMAPFLVLLAVILIVPLWGAVNLIRRKGNHHGSKKQP